MNISKIVIHEIKRVPDQYCSLFKEVKETLIYMEEENVVMKLPMDSKVAFSTRYLIAIQ